MQFSTAASGKTDGAGVFFSVPPDKTLCMKQTEGDFERVRKESTPFKGSRGPRKDTMVSSLGFLLTLYVPDLELKTLAIQTSQQVQRKIKAHRSLLSSQRTRKEAPSKTDYF